MKTATMSLVLSITILVLSLFQFDRFQKTNHVAQGSIKHLEVELKAKLEQFASEISAIKKQEATLLQQNQSSTLNLTEAKSLVSLSDVRLRIAHDLPGSIALLTQASEKIQAIPDSSLTPVQEALAADIKALQAVALPNIEELWLTISTLIESLSPLAPRELVLPPTQKTPPTLSSNTPPTHWKAALWDSLHKLKDLVKIRHTTHAIEPILSETEKNLVKENLRALLEQVRLSLLMQEDKIYQQALLAADAWLTTYYDDSHPDIQKAHTVLNDLKITPLRPELPILTSVELFKAIR